ncbi:MAG: DUF11 domain-containing protein, partial [Anaerolineae bacterium]|nr:DUF11 domain-containing protein [Anaerolineae bacterium]
MTAEDTIGRFRRWGYALALCCLLLALGVSVAWAQWAPSVVTDKPDYAPGETVIVTGSGFTAGEQYDIPVIRPDGTIVKGDGSFVPGWDVVTADGVGAFTYLYQLNGVPGDYEVRVYPVGTVALQSGTVVLPSDDLLVASTTFTDAESLSQWANGPLGGPPGGGEWVNGNVNQAKAHYAEGDSVPYRLILTGVPLGSHEVIIEWDTTKSGKHALDYITSWDRTASEANPCLGVPGCGPGVSSSFPIPQDPNVPFAQIPGNITIYNGTITGLSGYTLNGSYAGDSSTRVTIYFTNSSTTVVLAWGGHIGSRLDWGIGNSASAVSGSPYHMRFKGLDGKGGNMDRSLAAAAVYYFEVAVEKTGDAISKVGDTVNYTFTITNNSDSDSPALTLQSVTDVGTGWPGLGDLTAVASSSGCGTLTPGASCTFGASYTVAAGDPDPLQNTVTAIYYPVGAPANTVQHSDSHSVDLVHPSISVTKSADAATAFVGQVVTYTITVQNTSPDVDLVNLTVSDSLIGDLSADFVDELPIGASETNTYQRTVLATDPDPLVNTVTVHANPRGLPNDISDTDSASVDLVAAQISIEKATNGYDADDTPGPEIVVGDPVTWTYVVTNTGEVALIGITVLDDQGVAVTCPKTVLAVGESMTCTAAGTATAGQYGNVGTVTGSYNGHTVTDSDPSHYFGADPRIQVEKELSQTGTGDWEDVDSPPGPGLAIGSSVYFRFVVTNTGNVTLDNIALSDSVYDTSGCSLPASLAPGGSFTCVIGPLSVEAGLHTNTATASGERGEDSYSDTDDANYTGVMVAIDIEKATNGEDADVAPGPMIAEGDPVSWTYVVTNTGQVRVSDIVVVDDRGVSVSCPKSELDAGESMVCSASGTAVVGQYGNVGTVTGWYCGSWEVSDSDPSHYMGIANEPAIDIEKATNGEDADDAPGPVILVGDPVSWTYVVTNAGNVTLTGITVEDDVLGLVSCPGSQLEPGQSMTCAASGIATAGQYENVGTVRAYFGQEVLSDSDPSHYFGAEPGIGVAKYVSVDGQASWEDADEAPGPAVIVGSDVYFRFVVTNTGNVALESITLEDDTYDLSGCA